MKRTTIYLAGDPRPGPPGAGAFSSGQRDTADDVDAALAATGFGRTAPAPTRPRRTKRRA